MKENVGRIDRIVRSFVGPGLAGLAPLFQEGVIVPIVNAGSPHDTRSHFSAQDYMERGAPGSARCTCSVSGEPTRIRFPLRSTAANSASRTPSSAAAPVATRR